MFVPELTTDINVSGFGSSGAADNESAFNEFVGVVTHDFTIFASTGFRLVSVNDKIVGSAIGVALGDERVLET